MFTSTIAARYEPASTNGKNSKIFFLFGNTGSVEYRKVQAVSMYKVPGSNPVLDNPFLNLYSRLTNEKIMTFGSIVSIFLDS